MKQPRLVFVDYVNEIDAPIEQVFGAYKAVEKWPEWLRGVEASGRKWTQWKVGNFFWFRITDFPFSMPLRVFAFEENKHVTWGLGWPGSAGGSVVRNFNFEALSEGRTRVRHREWAEGLYIPFTWYFRPFVSRFTWAWASDLKTYCESGAADAEPMRA